MAQVCFGCGLTTNSSNELIVDTNGSVWPWPCNHLTFGRPVYCGSDGALRVDPAPRVRMINEDFDRAFASEDIPDEQTTFGFLAAQGGPSYTLTNPSTCYTAAVDLTEIWDFDFRPTENNRIRVYVDSPYGQIFDFQNRGDATVIDMGWNIPVRKTFTLAPGASTTITPSVNISSTGGSGGVMNKLQYHARGLIIAVPFVD